MVILPPSGDAPVFTSTNPLFALGVLLLAGGAAGSLAKRMGLPGITGQIVAGILLGPSVIHAFDRDVVHGLVPVTHFALGLMALTVGAHLNVRRLRNARKRLFYLWVAEATVTPLLVFTGLTLLTDLPWSTRALLSSIAVATAPATIVAIVRETRAQGVLVKTLVAAVALNNVACIVLFELMRTAHRVSEGRGATTLTASLADALGPLLTAILLGSAAALGIHLLTRTVATRERFAAAGTAAILLTTGLAQELGLSPLLACLSLGFVQSNLAPAQELLADRVFNRFAPAVLAIFFTLAGLELSFEHMARAGFIATVFFVLRAAGKLLAVRVAMPLAGATDRLRQHLGTALLPQAGLAIGLVLLLQEDPLYAARPQTLELLIAVVLTAVAMNEIAGPIFTRFSLGRAGEAGMDRGRLIDFLHEENIVLDLQGSSMDEVIEQLSEHLLRTHKSARPHQDSLRRSIEKELEKEHGPGRGLILSHGSLPEGRRVLGVMGLSETGLDLGADDGQLVHCVVLLATPEGEQARQEQILDALARDLGHDPEVIHELAGADTPAHAYEVLHNEGLKRLNQSLAWAREGRPTPVRGPDTEAELIPPSVASNAG